MDFPPNVDKSDKMMLQFGYNFYRGVFCACLKAKTEGLMYKGHPLRRVDNLIYYGTMAEKYIVMMQVLESKKEHGPGHGHKGLSSSCS